MLRYFLYFLLYSFYWVASSYLGLAVRAAGMSNFTPIPYNVYFVTYQYLLGGMLLGIPALMEIKNRTGRWSFDYKKAIGAGVPALYLGMHSYFYFEIPSLAIPALIYISFSLQEPMLMLLGFLLASCFYKTGTGGQSRKSGEENN
ncbi:hypothetical protein V1502_08605 [Bacillus sp. SCS-153A]|uniref:hypothetical protein n=1 Tax=Rossellomorea sedimentorum TaxID=3115294 RepID=UPI003905C4DE